MFILLIGLPTILVTELTILLGISLGVGVSSNKNVL